MKPLQRAKRAHAQSNVPILAKPVSLVAKLIVVAIMAVFLGATFSFVVLFKVG